MTPLGGNAQTSWFLRFPCHSFTKKGNHDSTPLSLPSIIVFLRASFGKSTMQNHCMPDSMKRKVRFAVVFLRAALPHSVFQRSHSSDRSHPVAWDPIEPLHARRKNFLEKSAQKSFCRPFGQPCPARTYRVLHLRRLRYNE